MTTEQLCAARQFALELAAKSCGSGARPEQILAAAALYLAFIQHGPK